MPPELKAFLIRSGLVPAAAQVTCTPLAGGISSDVWRIAATGRTFCVKRALPRLRVEAVWQAPLSRNAHEWAWINFAADIVPHAVPRLLAHDPECGMFAMEYLDPGEYPVWKDQLLGAEANPAVAGSIARMVLRLHEASAGSAPIAAAFRTDGVFYALRIEPYLLEAARRNPSVCERLHSLAGETLATKIALVHGDVSPKNILVGPHGPVLLDAETAWYGDPAFDLAFCLNHLLLKCLARPASTGSFLKCFTTFRSAYLSRVSWEDSTILEARATRLLPALLLARVDGKSPVEYLTAEGKSFVRETACALILVQPVRLDDVASAWQVALSRQERSAR